MNYKEIIKNFLAAFLSFKHELKFSDIEFIKGTDYYDNYAIISFHGGKNGCGDWDDYIKDISNLILALDEYFSDVWLIDLINDCPDDVFDLRIGVNTWQY